MSRRKKSYAFLITSLFVISVVIFTLTWKIPTYGTTNEEQSKQLIRDALSEINLAKTNDTTAIITASDNLTNFIYYRAGVQLSESNKLALRNSEQTARTQAKRITKDDLAQILADIALTKLSNLTDSQLSNATETLRGFDAPDLPASFQSSRGWVSLRSSGAGTMTPTEFTNQANSIRGSNANSRVGSSLVTNSIASEISKKVDVIRDASPDFFDNTKSDMTPMQAVLISYAVVADDNLAENQSQLTQNMQALCQKITQINNGQLYPSPQGHRAYGPNGYIYSSPTDLLMDEAAVNSLIAKIQERSGL